MGVINNILITGATGYLGSALTRYFVQCGLKVLVLKRAGSNVSKLDEVANNITFVDIEDLDHDKFFQQNNIDAIVHTAATYGRKGENLAEIYETNIVLPSKLLHFAILNKVKYFFYANTSLPSSVNEYSLSKRQFSDILKLKSNLIKVIDIELQYFYGPFDDDTKFVSYIIAQLQANVQKINLSPGTQVRDFIYIDDVVSAFYVLIEHADQFPNYTVIPLGSGKGITLKDLVILIKDLYPNSKTELDFGALPLRENEVMYSVADTSELNNIGWKPKVSLNQGLINIIQNKNIYDTN